MKGWSGREGEVENIEKLCDQFQKYDPTITAVAWRGWGKPQEIFVSQPTARRIGYLT
jgi:hypothetical protein